SDTIIHITFKRRRIKKLALVSIKQIYIQLYSTERRETTLDKKSLEVGLFDAVGAPADQHASRTKRFCGDIKRNMRRCKIASSAFTHRGFTAIGERVDAGNAIFIREIISGDG